MKKIIILILMLVTTIYSYAQIPCSTGISFNGTDDFISPDNTDAINVRSVKDRTIEFWAKTDDITTRQVIYEEGGGTHSISIFLEGGRVYMTAYKSSAGTAANRRSFRSGDEDIEAGKWFHVAFTLKDTAGVPDVTAKWFLNGVEQDSQDGLDVPSHTGDVNVGLSGDDIRFPFSLADVDWDSSSVGGSTSETYDGGYTAIDTSDYNYSGFISLFRIWNVARTQTEIETNISTFLTSGTNLVAYSDQDRIYYVPDGASEISLTAFVALNTQSTTIPDTDAINLQDTRDRTIEFRFKATDMITRQVLYEEGGNVNAIVAFIEDGRFYFSAYRGSAGTAANRWFFRSGDGDVVFNTWYHVAITLEDTDAGDANPPTSGLELKWYLDGVEQDSQNGIQIDNHSGDINLGLTDGGIRYPDTLLDADWTASLVGGSTSQNYNAGQATSSAANNFSGDFDLFRIWNVARTQTEIDTNKDVLLTSETDLVAYQSGTQMNFQEDGESTITGTVDAVGVITWDGSDSNVWATTTNWVGDNAPDATRRQKVAIPDGGIDPILTATQEIGVGFLTINSGVELIIESGATLNVFYGLDNNGTITVENGGSLIYHNCNSPITGSGTFNVIRNTRIYDDVKFFSYWSSPVIEADTNTAVIFPDANLVIYTYDASTTDANWLLVGSTSMATGVGYAIRNETTGGQVRTFAGRINEGAVNVPLFFNDNISEGQPGNVWSPRGDNLVGNPYSSTLDWDKVIQDKDNTDIEGTIYLWNQTSANTGVNNVSDYLQYNPTGGDSNTTSGKIGTAQAFFLRTEAATTLNLKPTHQITSSNLLFYRSQNTSDLEDKIGRSWFKISKENKYNTLLIGFVDGATEGYDRIYDGPFDINQTELGFYSFVDGNKKVTIQGLPELTGDEKIINLGFISDELGTLTISIQEEHINSAYYIYLEDTEENAIIDLREQDYTFTINDLEENNTRFRVIYTKEQRQTLSLDENIVNDNNFSVFVNSSKEMVINYKNLDQIEKITIFNLLGAEISTFSINEVKNTAAFKSGVYIVKATLDNGNKLVKKIVIAN